MATLFKVQTLQLTKQLVTASSDGFLYVNGNPVVAGVSGALNQTGLYLVGQIAATGSQAWNAANNNGINLSGNLTQTGATLQGRLNALSGFVGQASGGLETRIAQTGQAAVLYASGASGALQGYINSVSGYVVAASGGLEVRIVATGTAAINHANSIGQTISGNLTTTGSTLNNRVNALSGWVDQGFVHRTGQELISGRKIFVSSPVLTGIEFAGQSGSGIYASVQTDGVVAFAGPSGGLLSIDSGVNGSIFAVVNQYEAPYLDIYEDGRIYVGGFLSNAIFISGSGAAFGVNYVPSGYNVLISGNTQYVGNVFSGSVGGQVTNIADLFYPRLTNPSGYVTGATLVASGSILYSMLTGASGVLVARDNIISGVLATGIALTGSGLYVMLTGTSGALNTTIQSTGSQAWNAAQNNALNLSGNLTLTGQTLRALTLGGDTNLSGTLALTGSVLNNKSDSLSGWVNNIFVHRTGTELISGLKTFSDFLGSDVYTDFAGQIIITGSNLYDSANAFCPISFLDEIKMGGFGFGGMINYVFPNNALLLTGAGYSPTSLIITGGEATLDWVNLILSGEWLTNAQNNSPQTIINYSRLSGVSGYAAPNNANYLYRTGNQVFTGNLTLASGQYEPSKTISSNYNILLTDAKIYCNNTNTVTLTFPSLALASGQKIGIKLINTGSVILTGSFGQKFDGSDVYTINGQYQARELHGYDTSNWYIW